MPSLLHPPKQLFIWNGLAFCKALQGVYLPYDFVSDKSVLNKATSGRRGFFPPPMGITLWILHCLSVPITSTATSLHTASVLTRSNGWVSLWYITCCCSIEFRETSHMEVLGSCTRWHRDKTGCGTRCSRAPPAGNLLITATSALPTWTFPSRGGGATHNVQQSS